MQPTNQPTYLPYWLANLHDVSHRVLHSFEHFPLRHAHNNANELTLKLLTVLHTAILFVFKDEEIDHSTEFKEYL